MAGQPNKRKEAGGGKKKAKKAKVVEKDFKTVVSELERNHNALYSDRDFLPLLDFIRNHVVGSKRYSAYIQDRRSAGLGLGGQTRVVALSSSRRNGNSATSAITRDVQSTPQDGGDTVENFAAVTSGTVAMESSASSSSASTPANVSSDDSDSDNEDQQLQSAVQELNKRLNVSLTPHAFTALANDPWEDMPKRAMTVVVSNERPKPSGMRSINTKCAKTAVTDSKKMYSIVDGSGCAALASLSPEMWAFAGWMTIGTVITITQYAYYLIEIGGGDGKRMYKLGINIFEFEARVTGLLNRQLAKFARFVFPDPYANRHNWTVVVDPVVRPGTRNITQDDKEVDKEEDESFPFLCDGRYCGKMDGREFPTCVTGLCQPSSVPLVAIASEYLFVDKPVKSMSQSERRCVLYFYFYQQYFRVDGGERIRLPRCVVLAIRAAYPNKENTPYKGFKKS
jgi:hypothetical protein